MLTQETVDRIRRFRGDALPVLSVYLNLGPDTREPGTMGARLRDLLKPARAAVGSLDRRAANSLRGDIEVVLDLEKRIAAEVGHGVAVFSCASLDFFEYIAAPRKLWDVAVVGAKPYVRPLDALLDEFHRYCAVVVDRQRAKILEVFMGEVEGWHESVEEGMRKSNFGGWYGLTEYGVRRHAEELWHRHYRETATLIGELFAERALDLLLLGGHKGAVEEFKPYLPAWLSKRVAGTFTVDPRTATVATIKARCAELEERYERSFEIRAVEDLFGRAARNRLGVVGPRRTLDAVNAAAVDVLLIDGAVSAPGVECDSCGWLGLDERTCSLCGAETRPSTDIIEQVARRTVEEGGAVEHVFAETALRGQLVGAMLRFPIPEPPGAP